MSDISIEQHLDELRRADPDHYQVVQRIRETVRAVAPDVSERVMYGGIMFAAPVPFCGVFAYAAHVSLEFGKGYELADPHGVLEGSREAAPPHQDRRRRGSRRETRARLHRRGARQGSSAVSRMSLSRRRSDDARRVGIPA